MAAQTIHQHFVSAWYHRSICPFVVAKYGVQHPVRAHPYQRQRPSSQSLVSIPLPHRRGCAVEITVSPPEEYKCTGLEPETWKSSPAYTARSPCTLAWNNVEEKNKHWPRLRNRTRRKHKENRTIPNARSLAKSKADPKIIQRLWQKKCKERCLLREQFVCS